MLKKSRGSGSGFQGGYELRTINCENANKKSVWGRGSGWGSWCGPGGGSGGVRDVSGSGCQGGYELRIIDCENAKKSGGGVRVRVLGVRMDIN